MKVEGSGQSRVLSREQAVALVARLHAAEQTVVFTLRKGKIFLLEYFWDHAEALEAVGLSDG